MQLFNYRGFKIVKNAFVRKTGIKICDCISSYYTFGMEVQAWAVHLNIFTMWLLLKLFSLSPSFMVVDISSLYTLVWEFDT